MKSSLLSVLAGLALAAITATADVVSLSPSQDTGVFNFSPLNSFGRAPNNIVGTTAGGNRGRALFEFDIAGAIPAGSIINSVTLRLVDVSNPGGTFVPSTFSLHRSLVDWNGGTNVGVGAAIGDATWDYRVFETIGWGAPGGAADVDYASAASAGILLSQLSTTNGPGTNFWSSAGLVADVQSWLDNPGTNFGWFLISSGELTARTSRRFGMQDTASVGSRPLLTVEFSPVPEPATMATAALAGLGCWIWRRRSRRP